MSKLRLGDICLKIGSGSTPRGGKDVYVVSGNIALIRSQNIYNDRFERPGLVFLTDEHAKKLDGVAIQPDDVLLNITGDSVARVCQVPSDILPARVNQHVAIIRPDPQRLDPRFLRFWLVSPSMQQHMLGLAAAGATRNALTKGMIESFSVPDIPLAEQKAIGVALGCLEDKIDRNRRMNETLDSMARALFKDWFVDFGPVRAKSEGLQPPGLTHYVAELFPDSFDEDEKPSGWEIVSFGSLLESSIGGDWGKEIADPEHSEKVAIIRGTDIPDIRNGTAERVPHRFVTSAKLKKRALQDGDILIEVSGGSPTQPTGRALALRAAILSKFDTQVVPASFCRRFRPNNSSLFQILACHLDHLYRDGGTWFYQNQSTGIANFQTTYFLKTERVIIPSDAVLNAFNQLVEPLFRQIDENNAENRTLIKLSDVLLPKLISGEILIKNCDSLVGDNV
ncbi:type I restriction enzyme S subunit [Oxalobacteraceae bacterium GrIS 1.11]